MRHLYFLLIIYFLVSVKAVAQETYRDEGDFKNHILANLDNHDPIVGIYSFKGFENRYVRGEQIARLQIGETHRYAIIRQGSCFVMYNVERVNTLEDSECDFEATATPGVYLWNGDKLSFNSEGLLIKVDPRPAQEAAQLIKGTVSDVNRMQLKIVVTTEFTKVFPTQWDIQNASKKTEKSIASTGTGFALTSDGYIVTNFHVVENAKSIKVRGINNDFSTSYTAKVALSDKNNDLAILKVNDSNFNSLGTIPYVISNMVSDVGESVFVLGYPLTATMGEEVKLTNGIISSRSGFQGDITSYQISAPVQPGNSGGPMFDSIGNLVGIVNAKHGEAQNASYAIKTGYLYNLINALPTSPQLQNVSQLSKKSLSEQVKAARSHVYIIEVN
ncbi:hypothetical protein GCM10023188_27370 [Pontibacter saemangeumensis]|uniref:Trypsin-like peptidase domain-containing protein n=1 Tax=Pontibacter saemangeumensis TaxID=1084525 RepID=A0ABP8LS51_9BACT